MTPLILAFLLGFWTLPLVFVAWRAKVELPEYWAKRRYDGDAWPESAAVVIVAVALVTLAAPYFMCRAARAAFS